MRAMFKAVGRFLKRYILPTLVVWLYRALGRSWTYITENEHHLFDALKSNRPLVGAFLHARTFQLLYYFSRPGRGRWILMCSRSRDGELMAHLEKSLGYQIVRGSSGGGGARALVEMIKAQKKDRRLNSCLAVDGSRGPRGIAQAGIPTLAQKTGGLVIPVAASTASCRVLSKTWDRTALPRFGAKIHIVFGKPFQVPPDLDARQAETLRVTLESRLLDLHAVADGRTGFRDTQPLQAPQATSF